MIREPKEPLSLPEFRKRVRRYLPIQFVGSFVSLGLIYLGAEMFSPDLLILGICFLILTSIIANFWFGLRAGARLKAIRPEIKKPSTTSGPLLISPLFAPLYLGYLYFFDETKGKPTPFFLRRAKAFSLIATAILVAPLFHFSHHSSNGFDEKIPRIGHLTYWTTNATTHHISKLSDRVTEITEFQKVAAKSGKMKVSEVEGFAEFARASNTTEQILIQATSVMTHMRAKEKLESGERKLASTDQFKVATSLFNEQLDITENWRLGSNFAFELNPLLYLMPAGGLEIGLLTLVEFMIGLKYAQKFEESSRKAIQAMKEKDPNRPETKELESRLKQSSIGRAKTGYERSFLSRFF